MSISSESDIQPRNWRSLGLSFLLHTLLLFLVFLLIERMPNVSPGDDIRRGSLVLTFNNTEQTTDYLTEEDLTRELDSLAANANSPLPAEAAPPAIELPAIPDLPGTASVETLDATDMANVPKNSTPPSEFSLSKEDLEMIAKEQRALKAQQPKGPPASISVFGSDELTGQRFVFVIDRSQSMGNQGLGVLKRAAKELSSAINQLKDYHQFQIVAYHDRTITMSRRAMLPASDFNKQQAPKFIDELVAFGGTSHDYGLYAALAFHPDVVVFMTDGGPPELNGGHLNEIKIMSRGRTQIHTIQFGSGPLQATDNFMKQLARQSRGSFRYIDVNQWYKK